MCDELNPSYMSYYATHYESVQPQQLSPSQAEMCEQCRKLGEQFDLLGGGYCGGPHKAFSREISVDSLKESCLLCDSFRSFLRGLSCTADVSEDSKVVVKGETMYKLPLLTIRSPDRNAEYLIKYKSRAELFDADFEDGSISKGCNLSSRRPSPVLPIFLGSPEFALVRSWLADCHEEHEIVCAKSIHRRPEGMILLDCEDKNLCVNMEQPYVCLSYVWGNASSSPPAAHSRQPAGMLPNVLPRTILDAMTITRELGLRYLWVDRYCIDQSDDAMKHRMIESMDAICKFIDSNSMKNLFLTQKQDGCAELTIIAAAGTNPSHGLPGVSLPRIPVIPFVIGRQVYRAIGGYRCEIDSSAWNSRGWTFQEALLSRRCLIFTSSELFFRCYGMHCLENFDGHKVTQTGSLGWNSMRALRKVRHWTYIHDVNETLEPYFRKNLTFNTDVLNAVAGIFSAIAKRNSAFRNFYGIPFTTEMVRGYTAELGKGLNQAEAISNQSFVMALAWEFISNSKPCRDIFPSNPKDFLFPSWTWAAFKAHFPQSKLGALQFPLFDYWSVSGPAAKIHTYHRDGSRMNLLDVARHGDDYKQFHQYIDISSYINRGDLTIDNEGFATFLGIRETELKLRFNLTELIRETIAIYVGVSPDIGAMCILVQACDEAQFRVIGTCLSLKSIEELPEFQVENYEDFLRNVYGCDGWSKETIRLV